MTAGVGSCIDEDYSDEADGDFPVSAADVVVIDGAFIRNMGYKRSRPRLPEILTKL
jgi:hypothetical protein